MISPEIQARITLTLGGRTKHKPRSKAKLDALCRAMVANIRKYGPRPKVQGELDGPWVFPPDGGWPPDDAGKE